MEAKDLPSAPGTKKDEQDDNTALEEGSTLIHGAGRKKADQAVKARIIKLLNTGFHEQSNENEAKNAMKLAQRLMRKHNLSQAILLKERQEKNEKEQSGGADEEILKGGIVKVSILSTKTNKPAVFARWIADLTQPICKNFDVKSYHSVSRGRRCEVAFYGIYTNAQLAGYAFKVATERISQMAADYKPGEPIYYWEKVSTKSSRLSYAIGIVEGIDRYVDTTVAAEKQRQERKLERASLAATTGEAYEESDDDDNDDEGAGISLADNAKQEQVGIFDPYFEAGDGDGYDTVNADTLFDHVDDPSLSSLERVKRDLAKKVIHIDLKDGKTWAKEQKSHWKQQLPKEGFQSVWKDAKDYAFAVWKVSRKKGFPKSKVELEQAQRVRRLQEIENQKQAAIVLVNHREKIADEVLKDEGIKLHKGRKRSRMSFDRRSFHKGIVDSKEIDINQRAIKDEIRVKKEGKRRRP